MEITRECPLRCSICSSNAGKQDPNELSKDKWCETVKSAAELGFGTVCISGGEPLVSPILPELMACAKQAGLEVVVYTSGNIVEHGDSRIVPIGNMMSLLTEYVDRLAFGIHGPDRRTHDSITMVPGSFVNLMKSISQARNAGITCTGHFVPTKLNYQLLPEIVALSQRVGLSRLGILRFVPQGKGKKNREHLEITSQNYNELQEILTSLSSEEWNTIKLGAPFNFLSVNSGSQCSLGHRMTVLPNGMVVPCEALKDYATDAISLHAHSLEKVWRTMILRNPVVREHSILKDAQLGNVMGRWECPAHAPLMRCGIQYTGDKSETAITRI